MQTVKLSVNRKKALELYRAYKTHQHYQQPIDHAIQRAYQLIAQGRTIIKALESIKNAGVYLDGPMQGLPRLAICNAAAEICSLRISTGGSAEFSRAKVWTNPKDQTNVFRFPNGTFSPPPKEYKWRYEAMVPIVPIHLRPKRALAAYHILWEAEWTRKVPVDPLLLRRLSGDMWLVVAAWDLTPVEQAALATRLSA